MPDFHAVPMGMGGELLEMGRLNSEETSSDVLAQNSPGKGRQRLVDPDMGSTDFMFLQARVRKLEREFDDKTLFLMRSCNLTLDEVNVIYRSSPKLKMLSLKHHIEPILSRLSTEFRLSAASLGKLLTKFPTILYPACSRQFDDVVTFLQVMGINSSGMHRILTCRPQIFSLKIERNLNYTINFLLRDVNVPRHKLSTMLIKCPHIITLSVERKLRPALLFLQGLGLDATQIGNISAIYPYVFLFDVENKMRPTVRYLHDELNISSDNICRVICNKPQLLGYSVGKKLRPTVKFLVEEAGVPRHRIGDFVIRCPAMLGYSVDKNLRPTLNYIKTTCNISEPQDWMRYPRMLSYSLERRIKPRVESLTAIGHKLMTMGDVFHVMKQPEEKFRRMGRTGHLGTIHVL